jgi:hypothetical protein
MNRRASSRPPDVRAAPARHGYWLIGTPSSGRSELLERLIRHDIEARHGLTPFDPHAVPQDALEPLLKRLPSKRKKARNRRAKERGAS